MLRKILFILFAICIVILPALIVLGNQHQVSAQTTITPLRTNSTGEQIEFVPVKINDNGDVVGYYTEFIADEETGGEIDVTHSLKISNEDITEFQNTTSHDSARVNDINNDGTAVGVVRNQNFDTHAATWQGQNVTDHGIFPGSNSTSFTAISHNGLIAGIYNTESGSFPLLFSQNQMTPVGNNAGQVFSINNSGVIAGSSQFLHSDGFRYDHAVIWQGGQMVDLDMLPGGVSSQAYDINNQGQVVGETVLMNGLRHGFIWQSGQMTDLGALNNDPKYNHSVAQAINDNGDIVGESYIIDSFEAHAVIWQNGQIKDLNDLLPDGPGWVLRRAVDINNKGEIIGQGFLNGEYTAFKLTVENTPTPTTTPEPNQAPTVSAGTNARTSTSEELQLNGVVTDDGKPNPPGV